VGSDSAVGGRRAQGVSGLVLVCQWVIVGPRRPGGLAMDCWSVARVLPQQGAAVVVLGLVSVH